METHIADITRAIQLAVAPVFLLTAIGTLITALNNRLGRAVDRRRIVQERLQDAGRGDAAEARRELARLAQRSRLIYFAILAAVAAALLVCLVPPQGANGAPAFGGSAAAEFNEAASVGVHICAAGPPQGANCAPAFGGSAAAELINEAASVGVHQ